MKLIFSSKYSINYLFLFASAVLVTIGGLGVFSDFCIPLGIITNLLFLGTKLIKEGKINIPNTFAVYSLFVASLLIHTLVFNGKIIYFWMFFSGGLFWLSIYSMRDLAKKYFKYYLIFLGILMAALFVYFRSKGITFMTPDNLFLPISPTVLHNHIGDLWAVILVSLSYSVITKPKIWHIPFFILGLIFVGTSLSRSATVSLAAGVTYLISYLPLEKKYKKHGLVVITVVCLGLFAYFSIYKSTLFARPYFAEALRSVLTTPFGTGMGNFANVSPETNVVHNLVLEVVGGMGIFSIIFIFWLYKIYKVILMKQNTDTLFIALFITIFTNFFFDSTYIMSAFLWIWFIVLSLI